MLPFYRLWRFFALQCCLLAALRCGVDNEVTRRVIHTITGEEWQTARGQELSQGVDDGMRGVLRTGSQMEHRKNLGAGGDGQPQPQDVGVAAQPRPQLIQLEIGKPEVTENVFVQGLGRAGKRETTRW